MATVRAPSPRFKRPKARPNVQLTEDDLAILWQVYRHRVIDAESIRSLFPNRSEQQLTRRLRALYDAQFLDRPRQQNSTRRQVAGSSPMVYALDREGARLLRDEHGAIVGSDRWAQKNRELRGHNIEHALETTRFMVGLEQAVRRRPALELIHFDEILHGAPRQRTSARRQDTTIRTRMDWHGYGEEEGTAPDQIFGLRYLDKPDGQNRRFLFLEIDRGTETILPGERKLKSRSFFRDTSVMRKFVVYAQAFRNEAHKDTFGIPVFQVLTVTTNPARVIEMQRAFEQHLAVRPYVVKPGLFLFTDFETIARHDGDLLSVPYVNGGGKEVLIT
ncbi:replication-relaxation family protein [Microbaculum sp. FT89]|uniref:replication-relaxation family protein n=1 Tax=Microbaculum sp. FT89 TaxID=3447298 RepID=UPI003F538DC6